MSTQWSIVFAEQQLLWTVSDKQTWPNEAACSSNFSLQNQEHMADLHTCTHREAENSQLKSTNFSAVSLYFNGSAYFYFPPIIPFSICCYFSPPWQLKRQLIIVVILGPGAVCDTLAPLFLACTGAQLHDTVPPQEEKPWARTGRKTLENQDTIWHLWSLNDFLPGVGLPFYWEKPGRENYIRENVYAAHLAPLLLPSKWMIVGLLLTSSLGLKEGRGVSGVGVRGCEGVPSIIRSRLDYGA